MDRYKINYTFNNEKDINDILIKVLNSEIKKHISKLKNEIMSSSKRLEFKGENIVR